MGEVVQHACTIDRVDDFGMEHHAVVVAVRICQHGAGRVWRGPLHHETGGQFGDAVAMGHPDFGLLASGGDAFHQRGGARHLDEGTAELAVMPALGLAAQLVDHDHLAIADAQNRAAMIEDGLVGARRALVIDRGWPARQDDCLGIQALHNTGIDGLEGVDLAVDPTLAQSTGDQLCHLRPEIDDQTGLVMLRFGHAAPHSAKLPCL